MSSRCLPDRDVFADPYLSTCEADYSVGLTLDNMYRVSTYEKILAHDNAFDGVVSQHLPGRGEFSAAPDEDAPRDARI